VTSCLHWIVRVDILSCSQGTIQWCPVVETVDHMITGFSFGTKRKQYQKRKFLRYGTLKIVYQVTESGWATKRRCKLKKSRGFGAASAGETTP
jgi:hypothetical protein